MSGQMPGTGTSLDLPPVPRDPDQLQRYARQHIGEIQAQVDDEIRALPRLDGAGARRDPVLEVVRRSSDPEFHALWDRVQRGEAEESELRRHAEFGRGMVALAAEMRDGYR
jgi:hypothetical protein